MQIESSNHTSFFTTCLPSYRIRNVLPCVNTTHQVACCCFEEFSELCAHCDNKEVRLAYLFTGSCLTSTVLTFFFQPCGPCLSFAACSTEIICCIIGGGAIDATIMNAKISKALDHPEEETHLNDYSSRDSAISNEMA